MNMNGLATLFSVIFIIVSTMCFSFKVYELALCSGMGFILFVAILHARIIRYGDNG